MKKMPDLHTYRVGMRAAFQYRKSGMIARGVGTVVLHKKYNITVRMAVGGNSPAGVHVQDFKVNKEKTMPLLTDGCCRCGKEKTELPLFGKTVQCVCSVEQRNYALTLCQQRQRDWTTNDNRRRKQKADRIRRNTDGKKRNRPSPQS
jgi:hypothetical protein